MKPESLHINSESGPHITTNKIGTAIELMQHREATGPVKCLLEFLKLLDDFNIKWVTSIFSCIY